MSRAVLIQLIIVALAVSGCGAVQVVEVCPAPKSDPDARPAGSTRDQPLEHVEEQVELPR